MKFGSTPGHRCLMVLALIAGAWLGPALRAIDAPVSVMDNGTTWTLDNGIVTATINKRTGKVTSLIYKKIETMGSATPGYRGGWEEDPSSAKDLTQAITIDPAKNGGERAEVAIKGVTHDEVELSPTAPGGGTYCDMEIRYDMARGESGLYTYAVFSHPQDYSSTLENPRAGVNESRYGLALAKDVFNWMSVDEARNGIFPTPADWGHGIVMNKKEARLVTSGPFKGTVEHKYGYTAVQFKTPALGWSSTKDHIGIWLINPTIEYLSGGATKVELDCHLDANNNPDPVILDYWRGTHYGGAQCDMAEGESWQKVVGPIYIYCNSIAFPLSTRADALALWQDALDQAKKETAAWPYAWVQGVDYPHAAERGTVTGRLVLDDPQASTTKLPHLLVGLAHPDYANPGGFGGGGRVIDWQHDAKYYQFWVAGTDDGKFTIPKIRPGSYTLHAFADGVLGEYAQANITVEAGKTLDLGQLDWKPVRYGKQLWDIGVPNRTGEEFYKGDEAWRWGWYVRYSLMYPNDLTYTIGKSDYHTDWFFEQVPHGLNTDFLAPGASITQPIGWIKEGTTWAKIGAGRDTPWTIKFNLDKAPQGSAVLRVAVAGSDANQVGVVVNGKDAGTITGIGGSGAVRLDSIRGAWVERPVTFDASLLKKGENELQLVVPGGQLTSGIIYDYLRLELNEYYKPDGTPVTPPPSS